MKEDAIALGLATHLSKPTFVAILLLMSDVLTLLANLSRLLHVSALNLLYVEGHVQDTIHALEILKDNPFESSYMSMLQDTLDSVEVGDSLEKQHLKKVAHDYISTLVTKLHERFPQVHLLSLLRYFDLRNVHKAELMSMLEVGDILGVDGHQLWLEFTTFYHSFIERLDNPTLYTAMHAINAQPTSKRKHDCCIALISDILAYISVLPGSSAKVERVFSVMKRIRSSKFV